MLNNHRAGIWPENKASLEITMTTRESMRVICTISTYKMSKAVQRFSFLFENAALPPDSTWEYSSFHAQTLTPWLTLAMSLSGRKVRMYTFWALLFSDVCMHKWQFQNVPQKQFWQSAGKKRTFLEGNLCLVQTCLVELLIIAAEAKRKLENKSSPHSKGAKRRRCIFKKRNYRRGLN